MHVGDFADVPLADVAVESDSPVEDGFQCNDVRDIPLIEVSVEDGSLIKHCHKKRTPITFTGNAQEKKANGP